MDGTRPKTKGDDSMRPFLALVATVALAADAPMHTFGSASAPITIELYSDFQCPGCKSLHEGTLRELRRTYVQSGKVRLVYHDIHLPMHKYARLANCYACAAERLGLYDSVADKLFETQRSWEQTGKVDEVVASVVAPAQMMKLRAIATDPSTGQQLDARTSAALGQEHIPGTPTMLIRHGAATDRVGLVSIDVLGKYLDMLLAK